ncbi:TonB-dependent receptor domain-containing protein [Sphingomonas morindae]|uniref:TonB-dependent receptor n=1 Tax=Sphingomonas morindae TaxID=1541170 RepID=A0ABY4X784_9SPHN|nr:TonB-dependent receptor [Sphingomonas morindae]USI72767.1 TonB-dependent receptor [Sphingomonas morindae]
MLRTKTMLLAGVCVSTVMAAPALAQGQSNPSGAPIAPEGATSQARGVSDSNDAGSIVVTGSRITRPNATAAAPITSVTSEAIRAQAAVNVEDVLNRVPQIAPDSQQNYQDSDGRQRIKLRNLGFERTLVLVDGKRLGSMNGEDVNMIPTTLLKRIDVLTGGASAVYGSDAIAGVVNFVMDDDFQGIRIDGNYNFYAHKNSPGLVSQVASQYGFAQPARGDTADGGRSDLTLTVGKKLLDDRFHISAYVDYRKIQYVPLSARETSGCNLTQTVKDGPLGCSTTMYTATGYVSPQAGPNAGAGFINNPDGSRGFVPYSDALADNYYSTISFQRADERWNAGSFASFKISDAAELYSNVMWFRDKSQNYFPARILSSANYTNGVYSVGCNNPYLSASQAQAICGAAAGTATTVPVDLRYRLTGVRDQEDRYLNNGLRISSGVRGEFAKGWRYDVGGVYARNRQEYAWARPSIDRINNALNSVSTNGTISCVNDTANGCVPLDPFSAYSSTNNQALFDYILNGTYGHQITVNKLYDVLATVQGDLGTYGIKSPWAEQGVAVALTGEYRRDSLQSFVDQNWIALAGGSNQSLAQHAWEGGLEVQAPIIEHRPYAELLQVNGAYRASKYSSNPDTFSTWKAEALWAPVRDITFRASINRAQRAPTVVEAFQGKNIGYGRITNTYNDICAPSIVGTTVDPRTGQQSNVYGAPAASAAACAATGLAANLYGSPTLLCPTDVGCTYRSGGFTVNPETAYTKTFGVVLRPRFLPGLSVSVDRFMIDLNDSIGYNDTSYFSNGCAATGSAFFCDMFVRNPDGTLYSDPASNPGTGFIRQGTTNYYKSKSYGWDLQGQYTLRLRELGRLDFDFSGSLTTLAGGQDSPILPRYNCAGYYGGSCGQLIPKWTHSLRTTYTTRDQLFSASFNWRHLSSMTNVSNSNDPALGGTADTARSSYYRIPSYDYFDLALGIHFKKGYSIQIAANNLFDRKPPLVPNSYGYSLSYANTFPQRYDSLGRQIAISATTRF